MSELKLFGQGEMHLRVTTERLADRFGVTIQAPKPLGRLSQAPFATRSPCAGDTKSSRAGMASSATFLVEVGPRGRGEGFAFAERVHGGSVPRQDVSSVEAGATRAMTRGPLGFPVVDVSVKPARRLVSYGGTRPTWLSARRASKALR